MNKMKVMAIFIVVALTLIQVWAVKPSMAQDKPNILVIWGDDIGITNISAYSFGLVGYRTPNIDRIANEGIRFDNFFCTNSICAPCRAVILTGMYSHLNSVRDKVCCIRWHTGNIPQNPAGGRIPDSDDR